MLNYLTIVTTPKVTFINFNKKKSVLFEFCFYFSYATLWTV